MTYSSSKTKFLFLGVFCLLVHLEKIEGRPSPDADVYYDDGDNEDRNKRIIGLGTALDPRFQQSNSLDDDQDRRRSPPYGGQGFKTTYPPFPGDDDDYDRYVTTKEPYRREPETAPPYLPPSTSEESVYDGGSTSNNELGRSNGDKPFHHKIVPWFKRQWGHTKDFFGRLG